MTADHDDVIHLTRKQLEVLELLRLHMTSKEIARRLGISPHTVDQRIGFAKKKLNATSRSDLVIMYTKSSLARQMYGKTVYEGSDLASSANVPSKPPTSDAERLLIVNASKQSQRSSAADEKQGIRVVPEVFEGRYGTLYRIGAILLVAAMILIVLLGGLAMFTVLSELLGPD